MKDQFNEFRPAGKKKNRKIVQSSKYINVKMYVYTELPNPSPRCTIITKVEEKKKKKKKKKEKKEAKREKRGKDSRTKKTKRKRLILIPFDRKMKKKWK